ncbi:MAG: aldehyde dehydrogenase family protein [Asticcacaulis sp.]
MGAALEDRHESLSAVMVREAGKTWADAIAEVREAADFCRYYARLAARAVRSAALLNGPVGERNLHQLHGRGVFVCISPWNFPLAIFTGQIAAALAAGNAVLAMPAEQTPLIAHKAVKLFYGAGLHPDPAGAAARHRRRIGAALVGYPGIAGVAFSPAAPTRRGASISARRQGRSDRAVHRRNRRAQRHVSSIPPRSRNRVVDDVIASAFGSAGQALQRLAPAVRAQ